MQLSAVASHTQLQRGVSEANRRIAAVHRPEMSAHTMCGTHPYKKCALSKLRVKNAFAVLSECRSCPGVSPRRCFALVVANFISLVSVQARKDRSFRYTETSLMRQVSECISLYSYSEFQKAHYFLSEQRKFSTLLSRVLNVYSFVTHLSISSVIMLTIEESQIPKKRDDQPMGRVIMPVCADHIA